MLGHLRRLKRDLASQPLLQGLYMDHFYEESPLPLQNGLEMTFQLGFHLSHFAAQLTQFRPEPAD